jgi:hypothetical protein
MRLEKYLLNIKPLKSPNGKRNQPFQKKNYWILKLFELVNAKTKVSAESWDGKQIRVGIYS